MINLTSGKLLFNMNGLVSKLLYDTYLDHFENFQFILLLHVIMTEKWLFVKKSKKEFVYQLVRFFCGNTYFLPVDWVINLCLGQDQLGLESGLLYIFLILKHRQKEQQDWGLDLFIVDSNKARGANRNMGFLSKSLLNIVPFHVCPYFFGQRKSSGQHRSQ